MELAVGFIVWFFVGALLLLYRRFLATSAANDERFEHWCKARPIVIAFRCRDWRAVERAVRRATDDSLQVVNGQGPRAWPHYRVRLVLESGGDEVLIARVHEARLLRGSARTIDVGAVMKAAVAASGVEEAWMHGELRSLDHHTDLDRGRVGWHARLEPDVEPTWQPMIGEPSWLARHFAAPS